MRTRVITTARQVRASFRNTTAVVVAVGAAAVGLVTLSDVIFTIGLASLCVGVHQVYAPAAPIVAGLALMWAAVAPATPDTKARGDH